MEEHGTATGTARSTANSVKDRLAAVCAHVGEACAVEPTPEPLHRIEFRCVGRQALHLEPALVTRQPIPDSGGAANLEPVPEQQDATASVPSPPRQLFLPVVLPQK